jgi:hypothetical protein
MALSVWKLYHDFVQYIVRVGKFSSEIWIVQLYVFELPLYILLSFVTIVQYGSMNHTHIFHRNRHNRFVNIKLVPNSLCHYDREGRSE